MEKLSGLFKGLIEKLKNMSMKSKIVLGLLVIVIIVSITSILYYSSANKYGVLFTFENIEEGKPIIDKLQEQKIDMKVEGNSIKVPKEQVGQLRMTLAPEAANSTSGWELLDSASPFGTTDEQFNLTKQRILQGELEKTIKSFEQIQNARVLLTMPKDSVFVKDSTPGKASVYLKLKTGAKLSTEQVKSILAIVSGSTQNIPKENVEVVDDKMNLLSKDILSADSQSSGQTSLDNQVKTEADFEKKLEKALLELLQPAIGKDKVNVKVNADLDFDSKEKSTLTYDPNKVELSTHTIKTNSNTPGSNTPQSPVDNNMNNTIVNSTTANSTNTSEDVTANYALGEVRTKTLSAPGEIKRLTSSVMINSKLDDATKVEIEKAVAGVIGFKADRGDSISVVGMTFDTAAQDAQKAELEAMQQQLAQEQKMELYKNGAIVGSVLLVLLVAMIIFLVNKRRKRRANGKEDSAIAGHGIDVVIGDEIAPKQKIEFQALDFEVNDERSHIENEVKKYATNKPEQVADIIKSWLSEDER
jgi:flagellar M-ring protein FliF